MLLVINSLEVDTHTHTHTHTRTHTNVHIDSWTKAIQETRCAPDIGWCQPGLKFAKPNKCSVTWKTYQVPDQALDPGLKVSCTTS